MKPGRPIQDRFRDRPRREPVEAGRFRAGFDETESHTRSDSTAAPTTVAILATEHASRSLLDAFRSCGGVPIQDLGPVHMHDAFAAVDVGVGLFEIADPVRLAHDIGVEGDRHDLDAPGPSSR